MKHTSLVALAAAAVLGASSAVAQTTIAAGGSDLILGFRVNGSGVGSGTNLEVDLGTATQFNSSMSFQQLTQLSSADLVSTYGSDWFSRTDLSFGFVGLDPSTGSQTPTVFASVAEDVAGVQTVGADTFTNGGLKSIRTAVLQLTTGTVDGSLNGATSTANSDFAALISESGGFSWSSAEDGTASVSFGGFNTGTFEQTGGDTTLFITSDLYKFTNGTATYMGSIGLKNDGTLWWSPTASQVPEPSTYAAIFGASVLGFVAYRRRRANKA